MNRAINGAEKLVYITLGVLFLMMGVIGLIIPIIPGVLFLAGAMFMLSRGSSRVKAYADQQPTLRRLQQRMDEFDAVSAAEKVQVASLVAIRTTATGARKVISGVRRLVR